MIYITEHAINRFKERILAIEDTRFIKDKISDVVLSYQKLISRKNRSEKAYIKDNIVAITRIDGKDEIVLTIEPTSFINCWWNKQ